MARFFSVSILIACSSVACFSCTCASTGTACSSFAATPIVFVGRVLVDSGEGWGERPARVRVEEVLRGLSPEVREVEVDTYPRTSCYSRLKKDERYVIYARADENRPSLLFAGGCGYLFAVTGNEVLLDALRNAAAGGSPRLVGRVRGRSSRYGYYGGKAIAQTRVVAQANGKRYEALSDAAGWFEMINLTPGAYRIEASQPGYVFDDKENEKPVSIPANGCEVRDIGMTPAGRISGTVRYRDGRPAVGVKVGAYEMKTWPQLQREEAESSPFASATTADDGSYNIHPLPPGKYIVGVNGEKYEDRDAHPPSFYPKGATREGATWVELDAAASPGDIGLVLAEPRKPCALKITVVYEDGKAAPEATAKVLDDHGTQRTYSRGKTDANGQVELHLFQGEEYEVEVFRFEVEGRLVPLADGSTAFRGKTTEYRGKTSAVRLDKPEVRVHVVLHEQPALTGR